MVSRRVRIIVGWRRAGVGLRTGVFLVAVAMLALLAYWQRPDADSTQLAPNLLVIGLVNINLIILSVLVFLVGRNIAKLILDRRRKALGSKLRQRLVLAFVGLTLVPTIILFALASGLLTQAMEGWFSGQVERTVHASVEVAQRHYSFLRRATRTVANQIAVELGQKPLLYQDAVVVRDFFEFKRHEAELFSVSLLNPKGLALVRVEHAAAGIDDFREPEPSQSAIKKALLKDPRVLPEERGSSQFIRSYYPTVFRGEPAVLMVSTRVSPDLANALAVVNESYREYAEIKLFREPLRSGYLLTLTMITVVIIFSAIWIGFYIAREISVPIQRLAEGTRAVARGDYRFRLRESGDDEIAFLVRSFNTMTSDLGRSQQEAVEHQRLIEAILSNLAVGVVALDAGRNVTSCNAAAARLLGWEDEAKVRSLSLMSVLEEDSYRQIGPLLEVVEDGRAAEGELRVMRQGVERRVVCTAGRIVDDQERLLGSVLVLDDITDLVKAQQMSAWREVARRIAHEIKNPLTPIQLSAQRLQKLMQQGGQPSAIHESTQAIVDNVDSIKRLADEFSRFARMPVAELKFSDLNVLIADILALYSDQHPEVVFQFVAESDLPEIAFDREQIRRAIINLLDNAVAALGSLSLTRQRRVTIRTFYNRERAIAGFSLSDSGPGISAQNKTRVFEPYFSTKPGGTGLGLAIVNTIILDHQGELRLYDNDPHGATFVIELPLNPRDIMARRLVS